MPNYLIGVLAQREIIKEINACLIDTVSMDSYIQLPIISVNACPVDTVSMDSYIQLPIISVNACPVDTSTMNIIYDI